MSKMTIEEYILENQYCDLGLNADWGCSLYRIDSDHHLFEDDYGNYSLSYMPNTYIDVDNERGFICYDVGQFENDELPELLKAIKELYEKP